MFLSKEHPGIPDVEIIDKLLPKYRFLVTKDRVLHNRVLAKGFTSLILNEEGHITSKALKGIQLNKSLMPSARKEVLDNYLVEQSVEVHQVTIQLKSTLTQKCIEKNRTKRRRIRSHFADIANIASVDFTIGCEKGAKGVIGGYYLKVNAKQHLKALLNASEGYCLDQTCCSILSPVFYALSHLYCLHLSHVPVTLYITSTEVLTLCQNLKKGKVGITLIEQGVERMLKYLTKVELMPCIKGPFFERIQNKLKQMKLMRSNELLTLDFEAMAGALMNDDHADIRAEPCD